MATTITSPGETPGHDFQCPLFYDKKRVIKIDDRGEAGYRESRKHAPDRGGLRRAHESILRDIQEWFDQSFEYSEQYGDYRGAPFVPRHRFEEIMTFDIILQVVAALDCYEDISPEEGAKFAGAICNGTPDRPPCRKLLAVLILVDRPNEIEPFMRDDISDDCLPPFDRESHDESETLPGCRLHPDSHQAFKRLGNSLMFIE